MDISETKNIISKKELESFFAPLTKNKVVLYYPFYANTYVFKHHYGLVLDGKMDDIYLKEFDWNTNLELFEHIKRDGSDITVCFTNDEKWHKLENTANAKNYSVKKVKYSSFFYRYIFLEKDSYVDQLYEKACELDNLKKDHDECDEVYNNNNFKHPRFSKYIGQLIKKGYKSINLETNIPDEANSLLKKLFYEEFGLSYKLLLNEKKSDCLNIYIKGGPECTKTLFDDKEKYLCFEIDQDEKWTSTTYLAIVYHNKYEGSQVVYDILKVLQDYSNIIFSTVKEQVKSINNIENTNCLMQKHSVCNIHDRSVCKAWVHDKKRYCLFDKELFDGVNYQDSTKKIMKIDSIQHLRKDLLIFAEEKHFIRCLFNHHFDESETFKMDIGFISHNIEVTQDFRNSARQVLIKVLKLRTNGIEIPDIQIRSIIVWKEIFEKKLDLYKILIDTKKHENLKKMFQEHIKAVIRIENELNKSKTKNEEYDNNPFLNIIHFALHLRYFAETYNIHEIDNQISINTIEMFFLYTITKNYILSEQKPIQVST